jgi:hypothetical protein
MTNYRTGAVSSRDNDRRTGGSPLRRASQAKKLLEVDEDILDAPDSVVQEYPVSEFADCQQLLAELVIEASEYSYPKEKYVPADTYFSTIATMEVRVKNDKIILDVGYDLEDRYGAIRHILQSYTKGSQHYKKFGAAMVAAGLKPGQPILKAIGVTEMVKIDYVAKRSDIGSIVERKPYVIPPEEELDEETQELVDRLADDDCEEPAD